MNDQYDADMLRQSIADEARDRLEGMSEEEAERHGEWAKDLHDQLKRQEYDMP